MTNHPRRYARAAAGKSSERQRSSTHVVAFDLHDRGVEAVVPETSIDPFRRKFEGFAEGVLHKLTSNFWTSDTNDKVRANALRLAEGDGDVCTRVRCACVRVRYARVLSWASAWPTMYQTQ